MNKSNANIWKCRDVVFDLNKKPLIMGILNVTPDSFSDGGKFFRADDALKQAEKMIQEEADILDIGGESSRPFSEPVSTDEEKNRVLPIIEKLIGNTAIPISIDTYKPEVAEEALKMGVKIVNDISGCSKSEMIELIKKHQSGIVIMHMKGTPKNMQVNPIYEDVIGEIKEFFFSKKQELENSGVQSEQIVFDPGFGFGKRLEDNLKLLKNLNKFQELERPILIGTSRKSFIAKTVEYSDSKTERIEGTVATNIIGLMNGARIFRVHNVGFHKKALHMAWAVINSS
jgi:dihydropteroate synthase